MIGEPFFSLDFSKHEKIELTIREVIPKNNVLFKYSQIKIKNIRKMLEYL